MNYPARSSIRKSSSTDDSRQSPLEKNPVQTSSIATTSSSLILPTDEQRLVKDKSTRKTPTKSNHSSYRHTLLQALNPTTVHSYQLSPIKKLSKLMHCNNLHPSSMKGSKAKTNKCLILTQTMLSGSTGNDRRFLCDQRKRSFVFLFFVTENNDRCKSTSPCSNRYLSSERKCFTEDNFRQLLNEQTAKTMCPPSHPSLSMANEETSSSFSGWDEPSLATNTDQHESMRQSLTANTTTTTTITGDERVNTQSTVLPSSTAALTSLPVQQKRIAQHRSMPFNLARQLIAETSESEQSVTHHYLSQNTDLKRTGLSSSYNDLPQSSK